MEFNKENVMIVLKRIREKCMYNQFQYAIIVEAIEEVEKLEDKDE